jgi:hypothetical protein
MKDDPLDQLVNLYRQGARERSASSIDARILAAAEHASKRRSRPVLPISLAAAAVLALVLAMRAGTPSSPPPAAQSFGKPAYMESSTTAYLMQMDVTHTSSPAAQYLTSGTAPAR